ncbi:hypothetical protein CERSUDRAFT_117780 [Gelatoporia subvermispora B]|uniref:Transcription factor IIA alpha/beta subunit n=1 Tax=Ceriporiopsis subvermispora (strain B) TaxID=914234 RepID=M2PD65_CERS8|nr:hypothetical protein CERSUDRAFT_117780 [Gelatoporia subvermispora B]
MSNKIVPVIYRAVIDDVIASIKPEFDEYGISEEVLAELQHKWENKVMASHVAEFEAPPAQPPPQHPQYPPHPMHMHNPHYPAAHNPYVPPPPPPQHAVPPPGQPHVKSEPVDSRYMLNGAQPMPYGIPPLAGPPIPGRPLPPGQSYSAGAPGVRPASAAPPTAVPAPPTARYPPGAGTNGLPRIPQVDGPSSSSSGSPSPPPSQGYAPRPMHPSLPQPAANSSPSKPDDSEAINSDLDDSDSGDDEEGDEGGGADTDIVFCTYDKVARVKNKWKCILKDGMIHINGKDYLFAKCTGEFEW